MKINSLGNVRQEQGQGNSDLAGALKNAHAHLVSNASIKNEGTTCLKGVLQSLQDANRVFLIDTLSMGSTPLESQTHCANDQAEMDLLADPNIVSSLFWNPNPTVIRETLSLSGFSQGKGESISVLDGMPEQVVSKKWQGLDPNSKGEVNSLAESSKVLSVVLPRSVGSKVLDVERSHNTLQAVQKDNSRLQKKEERKVSNPLPLPLMMNPLSEPIEVSIAVGEKGDNLVAELSALPVSMRPLVGAREIRDAVPAFNKSITVKRSLPRPVKQDVELRAVVATERFAPFSIHPTLVPTMFEAGELLSSLMPEMAQGLNAAMPDATRQVNTAVFKVTPDLLHFKPARAEGGQSERATLESPITGQIVGALVLARDPKASVASSDSGMGESFSERLASTPRVTQAERSVSEQAFVMSGVQQAQLEPTSNGTRYDLSGDSIARPMPAPALKVLPDVVERQGFTYHFKSWGKGSSVSVNALSAGDVQFVPSDGQVFHALQTYGENHEMPQHWRIQASERRDDEMPRRQARALPAEEENEE